MFNSIKINFISFCFLIISTNASAQSFEELYAKKWCRCTEVAFPQNTQVADLLEKTGIDAGGGDTYNFEKLEAYFKENPEEHKNFGIQLEQLENCVNQNNVDLSALKTEDLEELTLQEKTPKNNKKLVKKLVGVNEILKKDKSCPKGQSLFALWFYSMSNKQ